MQRMDYANRDQDEEPGGVAECSEDGESLASLFGRGGGEADGEGKMTMPKDNSRLENSLRTSKPVVRPSQSPAVTPQGRAKGLRPLCGLLA